MFYLMLASGSLLGTIGLLILLVLAGWFTVAMFQWAADDLGAIARGTGDAIKESDWYKAREERKEIEAMERQLKKKELQKKTTKRRVRKR